MAKLRGIATAVKPKPLAREKLYCAACGGDDVLPNSDFRGDIVDGLAYLECTVCRGDLPPLYTKEAVAALVAQALAQASQDDPDR